MKLRKYIFIGVLAVFTSCDNEVEIQEQPQIVEQLELNSIEEKVNYSAGYNQCMDFYNLTISEGSKGYFNIAAISNGYIEGMEKGNISDSIHHSNILEQSFSGVKPDTSMHSVQDISFAYGYIEALKQLKFFKEINFDLKTDYIKNGYTVAAVGQKPPLSQDEMNNIVQSYITDVTSSTYENFLTSNAKREEVTSLPSGLQYEIVEEGKGPNAILGDSVKIHWIGKHISGEEFVNSRENNNNEPFSVALPYPGILAMNEALLMMNEGAKYKFYAPSIICYGKKGMMDPNKSYYIVKPNEPLIFEIEVVKIN